MTDMTDLIERLRSGASLLKQAGFAFDRVECRAMTEAADALERLTRPADASTLAAAKALRLELNATKGPDFRVRREPVRRLVEFVEALSTLPKQTASDDLGEGEEYGVTGEWWGKQTDAVEEALREASVLLFDSLYHLRLDEGARIYDGKAKGLKSRIDALIASLKQTDAVEAVFETPDGFVMGQTAAKVKRIERQDDGTLTVVIDHWPDAVEAERERCARIAEDESLILSESRRPGSHGATRADHGKLIAAAIRGAK